MPGSRTGIDGLNNRKEAAKRQLEEDLRRGYAVLRNIATKLNHTGRHVKDLTTVALFLKAYGSIYVTLPCKVDRNTALFVEKYRFKSAAVFCGDLIESLLQRTHPTVHRLLIGNSHTFLNTVGSLEDVSWKVARSWQSACLFRKERLLIVWSGNVSRLLFWINDLTGSLVQAPNALFLPSRVVVDESGIEPIDMSNRVESKHEAVEENLQRHRAYEDSVLIGLSVMSVSIILIGVLGKELALRSLGDSQWSRMAWILTFPLIGLWMFPIIHKALNSILQIMHAFFDRQESSPCFSGMLPSLSAAYESGFTLPHITIIVHVYKESLEVIMPTIHNVLLAVAHYEMRGGTANIVIPDDGLQLLSDEDRDLRIRFYADCQIGWVARPGHGHNGYVRLGKFKKASSLNNCLQISRQVEEKMTMLNSSGRIEQNRESMGAEDSAQYKNALMEIVEAHSGKQWVEGNIRMGSYIMLVDSDSRMPPEGLIYAAAELHLTPELGLLVFLPQILQVTSSISECWASFTAIGDFRQTAFDARIGILAEIPSNFLFLQHDALRSISYLDDDFQKIFSESSVLCETELCIRLQLAGYMIRASSIAPKFRETFRSGVSLTLWDQIAYHQKTTYGWLELCFHSVVRFHRGPLAFPLRAVLWSTIPVAHKLWILQRVGMCIVSASEFPLFLATYLYIGWHSSALPGPIDAYVRVILFFIASLFILNFVAKLALHLRYRYGSSRTSILIEHLKWVFPTLIYDLGTTVYHLSVCGRYFLGIDVWWSATTRYLEQPHFWLVLWMVMRRSKKTITLLSTLLLVIILSRFVLPPNWQIRDGLAIAPISVLVIAHFLVIALGVYGLTNTWS